MKRHTGRQIAAAMALAALAGCAGVARTPGASGSPVYRCDNGVALSVRFTDGSAVLEGAQGPQVLLRDAGGQGAHQTVFSSPKLRAEFGLGADARQALLHYFEPPRVVRCQRD